MSVVSRRCRAARSVSQWLLRPRRALPARTGKVCSRRPCRTRGWRDRRKPRPRSAGDVKGRAAAVNSTLERRTGTVAAGVARADRRLGIDRAAVGHLGTGALAGPECSSLRGIAISRTGINVLGETQEVSDGRLYPTCHAGAWQSGTCGMTCVRSERVIGA